MKRQWSTPVLLVLFCPAIGMAVGAVTNLINVCISTEYYAIILGWDLNETPGRVAGQGMLEGGALGLAVGLFLAISAIASTGCRCPLGLAMGRLALRATGIALICWLLGGVGGVILYLCADERTIWRMIYWSGWASGTDLLRFLWVGGSIVGAYVGAGLGLLYAAVALHLLWKKTHLPPAQGFTVSLVNKGEEMPVSAAPPTS